jgi:hypothetical protein
LPRPATLLSPWTPTIRTRQSSFIRCFAPSKRVAIW